MVALDAQIIPHRHYNSAQHSCTPDARRNNCEPWIVFTLAGRKVDVLLIRKEIYMYIDPNTGGILFQALAGLLAVLSGVLLLFSRNIRQFFSRLRRNAHKDEDDIE
jgi:hypothetical protein